MTELSERELELLKPYLKLIDTQAKENTQLHIQNELIRYNRRFTNKKFIKKTEPLPPFVLTQEPPYVQADPTFISATKAKGITYVQEETKPKRTRK